MKSILLFNISLAMLLSINGGPIHGQDDTPKAAPAKQAPVKQIPQPGKLEITVTSGDKEKSYTHPAKALPDINRALSRAKRAKEGEEPIFETAITLNEQLFTFSDPEAALEACKGLAAAMRDLPKLRMGLGDLGEIPEVKPEEQPAAAGNSDQPKPALSPAAAQAEVRRRINAALQRQMIGTGSIPNAQSVQNVVNQELERARREGLLPANGTAANPGGGFAGGDPREAHKETIVQTLAFTFSRADSTSKTDEKPADDKAAEPKESEPKEPESKTPEAAKE
jgi:hypothetical protein